ncbi:hypothetical protein ABIE85_001283 [Bradyrhizobium diazoefficiens]|jgi:hypothetical protein
MMLWCCWYMSVPVPVTQPILRAAARKGETSGLVMTQPH